mgnify:CR=1 FL=1
MKNHQSELRAAEPNIGTYSITVSAYKGGDDKMQSFSMSCDLPMIKGTPPGVSSLGSAARNLD